MNIKKKSTILCLTIFWKFSDAWFFDVEDDAKMQPPQKVRFYWVKQLIFMKPCQLFIDHAFFHASWCV